MWSPEAAQWMCMVSRFRLWFDFRVSNNVPGQRTILTITNFSKTRSLYRHGMTPVYRILSSTNWHRIPPKDVFYYRSPKHNHNYILSMAITLENLGDVYEIAYTYPYTYTRIQYQLAWIDRWNHSFVRRELLCRSEYICFLCFLWIPSTLSGVGGQ